MSWQFASKVVSCYHQPQEIFQHEGVTYYAADESGVEEFSDGLVLNLTRTPHTVPSHSIPELVDHFDIRFEEVLVPCPDFGLPAVKPTFWKAIHRYAIDKGHSDVCIHCQAGHGRTGTVMCSMLIALKGLSAKKAVTKVRAEYCKSVVESARQVDYLREMDYLLNGRKINERDGLVGSSSLITDLERFNF